ncbi:FAD-dependent monooxygenase [Capillimicrobium parvum]|uniref:Pentachlorophenol 4-monooxygenase n=1 Tax=Capillimicrobium parvum TaxID=2884022 RepID=A0A9E6XY55_9ACTN|nr:FAD-dependent monooxygenase [Capillimicrobium parvum]UGS36604.1 Pentachlorophenol 4-monooxygenase [Capillimicrobium parvum]
MIAATDVLVVGAGPVGLTLACELARHGVACRVVDRAPARSTQSRATDLHARSLELWGHTGVAGAILARAVAIESVPLFSGGREVARLDFRGIDSDVPAAVSLRQHDLEAILEDEIRAAGIAVEWGVGVDGLRAADGGGVVACDGEREVGRAGWVVACDGVHSALRSAAGIAFAGGEFPGRWAALDAEIDAWPYGPGDLPVFLDADGFWAMPLPGGAVRMFFRDDAAPVGAPPSGAEAQAMLDRHVGRGARISAVGDAACFTIHHRVARRFRAGRLLLAGDAAHAMTPVSGQGMNTGIQDAFNLAWKLRLALAGAPDALVDSYEAERRPVALATVRGSRATHEANVLEGEAAAARDRALAAALATPAEVLAAVEAGHELAVAYHGSPIVQGVPGTAGPRPGDRVPDAGPLVDAAGRRTSLRELMRAPGLLVLDLAGSGPAPQHAQALAAAERRGGGFVAARTVVIGEAAAQTPVPVLSDPTLRVHGRLGPVAPTLLVVRPDGYLGLRAEPFDAAALDRHLTLLGL